MSQCQGKVTDDQKMMFSSVNRVLSVLGQKNCRVMMSGKRRKNFSSNPPYHQETSDVLSTLSQRYYDLPSNNAGITRREFQARRLKLAQNLASQVPLLSSSMTMNRNDDEHKNHLVIIPSAQRRYMVDKIPYHPFRQATDFRYRLGFWVPLSNRNPYSKRDTFLLDICLAARVTTPL